MDPTEVYARFDELAAQFPDIAELVPLPNPTSGYQRKASTVVGPANFTYTGQTGTFNANSATQVVVLESLAMGHEGGNQLTAQLVDPGVPNSPLSVTMIGNDLTVSLATDANGAPYEHGGAGRGGDQRLPGGERPAEGVHDPRQRGRRHRRSRAHACRCATG